MSAEHNVLELGGPTSTADLFGGRIDFAHSATLFAAAWVQYNRAAEELVSSLRLNLIHSALSDLFLVYTERRDVADGTVLDRRATIKVTKMLAL